ncbi:MAG: DUF748 domain-containing protein, partial [Armatimonadetes bacterium]|nr:DUF748 domain-containing protein [Armatimonadota bacterium]
MRTLLAAVIVLLALAGFLGLVAERAQVPDAVRQGILAAVSEGLGRRVSLGAVRGSPWRGVVLEDVLITEPDGQTPFVRARRVTVRMNPAQLITDLLTGRGPLASINAIDLEDAYLRVARDGRGRWNYADLVARQRPPDPSAPGLRARLTFSRGTVLYYDALQLPTPFHVVMSRVEGSLDMRRSPRVAVDFSGADEGGGRRVQARVRGSYLLRAGTFSLDVDVARVDLRHWASYLLRLPRLDWQAGTVDGRLQLTSERWRNRNVLDYRGTLMLRDGQALLLPQRALLAGVNGPMEVDNLRVASAGLRGSLQGAPLAVRGEIRRTPDPLLDLVVKSSNLDLATLKFLFFPRAGLTLSGRASGEVRVAGILSIPRVEGSITAAQSTLNRQPVEAFSGTVGYDGRHLTFADVTARLPGGSALAGHVLIDLQRPGFLAQAHATSMDLDSPLRLGLPVLLPARGPATGGFVAAGHRGRVIALAGLRMGAGASFRTVLPIEDAEGVIWYDSGTITVDALALRRGATGVYLSGQIGAGGALNLSVVGERVALAEVDTYLRLGGLLHGEA